MSQKTAILPTDQIIDFFGHPLRIERVLSDAGYTSIVYKGWLEDDFQGKLHVAVKAMKPLAISEARRFFEEEAITLARLHQHFKRYQDENVESALPTISPLYYGRGEYEGTPFIVMEFVEGKEISEVMREFGGKLPEPQALVIGWQLFGLLDILHEKLDKTLVDLKFENLRWLQDSEGNVRLKILDFGTLEDKTPNGVKRDLLLGSVYLCYMLTGRQPSYSLMGYLRKYGEAEEIIRKAQMSWGTRDLLYRMLHRNPQLRPNAAAEVANQLRVLFGYWSKPVLAILNSTRQLINKIEDEVAKGELSEEKIYQKAKILYSALSICTLREPQDQTIQQDIERVDRFLKIGDYMEMGKRALRGRAFDIARQYFTDGMHSSMVPAMFRRWIYLTYVGEDVPPEIFDHYQEKAYEMVEWLNEGDLEHGIERLESLRAPLKSKGLEMLYADARMHQALRESLIEEDARRYRNAAQLLREAVRWLEILPDVEAIRREEIGDLDQRIRELENQAETVEKARNEMERALSMSQMEGESVWEEIFQIAEQAFGLDPYNSERLQDIMNLVENALRRHAYAHAQRIVEIPLRFLPLSEAYYRLLFLSRTLWHMVVTLEHADWDGFFVSLRDWHARNGNLYEDFVSPLILQASKFLLEAEDLPHLKMLVEVMEKFGRNEVGELREEIKNLEEKNVRSLRETVDTILIEIRRRLWQIDPFFAQDESLSSIARDSVNTFLLSYESEEEKLREISRMLEDAKALAAPIDYKPEEFRQLEQRLSYLYRTIRSYKEKQGRLEERRRESLERIRVLHNRLKVIEKQRNTIEMYLTAKLISELSLELSSTAFELLRQCMIYRSEFGDHEEIRNFWEEAIAVSEYFDWDKWSELSREIENRVFEHAKKMLREAEQYFEQGNLTAAAATVDLLRPYRNRISELAEMETRIRQAEQAVNLERLTLECNPENLRRIRALPAGLPARFYHPFLDRLMQWRSSMDADLLAYRSQPESEYFFRQLRLWIDMEGTRRIVERKMK